MNNSTNALKIPAKKLYSFYILYCTFIHYGTPSTARKKKLIQTHTVKSIKKKKRISELYFYNTFASNAI